MAGNTGLPRGVVQVQLQANLGGVAVADVDSLHVSYDRAGVAILQKAGQPLRRHGLQLARQRLLACWIRIVTPGPLRWRLCRQHLVLGRHLQLTATVAGFTNVAGSLTALPVLGSIGTEISSSIEYHL